jgi:hypothetical protein
MIFSLEKTANGGRSWWSRFFRSRTGFIGTGTGQFYGQNDK